MTKVDHIDLDNDDIVVKVDYVDLISEEEDNAEKEDQHAAQSENAGETAQEQEKGATTTTFALTEQSATASSPMTEQHSHETAALLSSPPISATSPFSREFWKAGDYKITAQDANNNGEACLRIHPKFLHSNATAHKWAFGAIAELLDNAVDEVNNGATFVKIDKMKYSPLGEFSLVIQDDGGGMSPDDLRHCMSFGFSNKCTDPSIGRYGNGFKSSTMRLGADVIVFTCRQNNSKLTRSVGLLSYTFLARTGCSDILVPLVDYEFDASCRTFKKIMHRGEKNFSSNLSTLLRWSPFPTEDDLLNQFADIGCHGTKIVVFNLWFNDTREMELDFTTDDKDIIIAGAAEIPEECTKVERLNHMHIANRFRYSLRIYASILYLHLPEHFKVILCGKVIEPHDIGGDLMHRECITYRPKVGARAEVDVFITIGFLKGAPKLDVYGFNVYHKNRLILPFWSAGSETDHDRGIVGVLEGNFINTHDKQDFEKTKLFQKLERHLKKIKRDYWTQHNGLLTGCTQRATTKTRARSSRAKASVVLDLISSEAKSRDSLHVRSSTCPSVPRNTPHQTAPCKRRNSFSMNERRDRKRQNIIDHANQPGGVNAIETGDERSRILISRNQMLKAECSELEAAGQELQCKADFLRQELHEWQWVRKSLADELEEVYENLRPLTKDELEGPYERPSPSRCAT